MIMSTPSMRSRRSGEASLSDGSTATGRRLANRPSTLRILQQPLLGPHRGRRVVPLGSAHRAQEHGIRRQQDVEVLVADGGAVGVDGDAAGQHLGPLDGEVEALGSGLEDHDRRVDDLGTDAVAGDPGDPVDAGSSPGSWPRSTGAPLDGVVAGLVPEQLLQAPPGRPPGRPR